MKIIAIIAVGFAVVLTANVGAQPAKRPPVADALTGADPSRWFAVSSASNILVSTGGSEPLLEGDKKPFENVHRFHIWEWNKNAPSRVLNVEHQHRFAVSPDGRTIVTTDGRKIDTMTGAVGRLEPFASNVISLAFSPNGKLLLLQIKGDREATMSIIRFPDGSKLCDIAGQQSAATFAAAFSEDGSQVALTDKNRKIHRYETATGRDLAAYEPAHENSIRAISISRDGKHLASVGTRGEMYVWETTSGRRLDERAADNQIQAFLKTVAGGPGHMECLTFSPDGNWLAGGTWERVHLWRVNAGEIQLQKIIRTNPGSVTYIRFSDDSKHLIAVHDFYGAGPSLLAYPTVWEGPVETTLGVALGAAGTRGGPSSNASPGAPTADTDAARGKMPTRRL